MTGRGSSSAKKRVNRRSAHDRRLANAMRFLMKILRARQASRLIHAFRQNPLWIPSGCAAVFVSPAKPGLAIWLTGAAQIELMDLLARAQSCFSNLLLRPAVYP